MKWIEAPELREELRLIAEKIEFDHIQPDRIFCYSTTGAKTRAIARIWGFPKIFQKALSVEPAYVLEVVSERYEKLSSEKKTKVLIHEMLHIPKNFSGALLPHTYGKIKIDKEVERLFKLMK
jgi:predicted metallopeptidase